MIGIYFFYNLILVLLFFWYCKKSLILLSSARHYFILLFFVILKSALNICDSYQINFVITILTYFSISYIFFEGTFTRRMIFIGFYLVASFISEIISYVFLEALCNHNVVINDIFVYSLVGNCFSRIILIAIIYLITKVNDVKKLSDGKDFSYFMLFPLISLFIIYAITNSNILDIDPILCIMLSFGIIVFNIMICKGFVDIMKSKNFQIENEKLKTQELHYLLLEEKIESSRKFIHDFKKHVNIIYGYVYNQDITNLKSYLSELSTELKHNENFVVTGNQIIDLSLNANNKMFIMNKIDIKYDVKVKDIHPISAFDFNIVFSNILDNAIESCIRVNGHFIKIKLVKANNFLILKVINPCFDVKRDFKTIKNNTSCHGYGIKNIKKIVQKYEGSVDLKFDEENHIFISTVIFHVV